MAWTYSSASRVGLSYTVLIHNTDVPEGTPPLTQSFTYTKPATGQTVAQFKAMVNREVRAIINQLNAVEQPVDATTDFNP